MREKLGSGAWEQGYAVILVRLSGRLSVFILWPTSLEALKGEFVGSYHIVGEIRCILPPTVRGAIGTL